MPVSAREPDDTTSATVLVPDPSASWIVPPNVDGDPVPANVSVLFADVLLLPITFAVPVPAVDSPPTVGLNPFRSRVPLVVPAPRVTAVPAGSAPLAPSWRVPFWTLVPPV